MEKNMGAEKEWVDWLSAKVLQKAVVVDDQGNMLALRRTETGHGARPGKWDLPGGSMSTEDITGENPHESAIGREVEEETGLNISKIKVVHIASGVKKTKTAGGVLTYVAGFS